MHVQELSWFCGKLTSFHWRQLNSVTFNLKFIPISLYLDLRLQWDLFKSSLMMHPSSIKLISKDRKGSRHTCSRSHLVNYVKQAVFHSLESSSSITWIQDVPYHAHAVRKGMFRPWSLGIQQLQQYYCGLSSVSAICLSLNGCILTQCHTFGYCKLANTQILARVVLDSLS